MMMRSLIVILLLATGGLFGGDALKGNRAYGDGDYAAAADAYRKSLSRAADLSEADRFAVEHNLAAALYRIGDYEEARVGFDRAANLAPNNIDHARSAYNAGNAAMAMGRYPDAAELFRQALRANPGDEDARINYEYARRMAPPPDEEDQDSMDDGQGDTDGDDDERDAGPDGAEGDSGEQSAEDGAPSDDAGDDQPSDTPPHEDDGDGLPEDAPPTLPETEPQTMTEEEAEQILNALQRAEGQLLREVQRAPTIPRRVEKDW